MGGFRVGETVWCSDNSGHQVKLTRGSLYTVARVTPCGAYMTLVEIPGVEYSVDRFSSVRAAPVNNGLQLSSGTIGLQQVSDPKKAAAAVKPPLHLNPTIGDVLQSYAHLNGATKYKAFNWRFSDGIELMTYLGAIKRHVSAIIDGEDTEIDPVTGIEVDHLGAIMATAAIIADAREYGKLIDDRPKDTR